MNRHIVRLFLLLTMLTGWGLALVRLGERSLWADEGFTAVLARDARSQGILKTLRLDPNQGALHLLLEIGVIRLGGSEFILRFPSAVAATLALPVVYLLGRRLMSREAGLAGAFLLSISPFAVGYAQEARPYALLELLSCVSLLFLLLALERDRWLYWAGFSAAACLLFYTHYFAWFVVCSEALYCLAASLLRTRKERKLDRRLLRFATSLLAAVALYFPWLPVLLSFWRQAGPGGSPLQAAGLPRFQLSLRFFRDMIAVLGARAYGWQVYLFSVVLLLGLIRLGLRKKWNTLLLMGLWFAVPLSALSAFSGAHFFDFRYVIFFVPLLLLVAAEGLAGTGWLLAGRHRGLPVHRPGPALTMGLAILLFLPANSPALRTHYRWEKENWRNIGQFLSDNLLPSEAIYVSPRYWSYPLIYYQPALQTFLVGGRVQDVSELVAAAGRQPGLWFLRYAGPLGDPTGQLQTWIEQQGYELLIDGRACGSGIHVYYGRSGNGTEERKAELMRKAAEFCPGDPRFQSSP